MKRILDTTFRSANRTLALVVLTAFAVSFAHTAVAAETTKILFLAGPKDHGIPGRHEYERDLRTLAQSFENASNLSGIATQVIVGRVPRDLAAIRDAAVIVINSSSDRHEKETHPLFPADPSTNHRGYDADTTAYLQALDDLIKEKKIGVVILHYALWAENWRARELYINWTGGLWVQIGSKNPTDVWKMSFETEDHPILRGVEPWTFRDEIFCRFFLPNDPRRTDLLLATAKEDKMKIGPQIASWAYERDDGGRAFVFGGQDFRDNLALDDYRRFLLNGIAWAAHIEIPSEGIRSPTPDVSDTTPRTP